MWILLYLLQLLRCQSKHQDDLSHERSHKNLTSAFSRNTPDPEQESQGVGYSKAMLRALSAVCVRSPGYGTRSHYALLILTPLSLSIESAAWTGWVSPCSVLMFNQCRICVFPSQDQYSYPHRPRGKRELYGAHHAKLWHHPVEHK